MADSDSKSQRIINQTDLSGPASDVPYRAVDSKRKTGPPRLTPYEAHTVLVAPQKQLGGSRVTRKGDTSSQVAPPSSEMVAGGGQCAPRSTITPTKHALQLPSNEGWGAHLNNHTARGTCSLPETKLHINYLELKAVFFALKEFQDLCKNNIVLIATDNTTVVAYINKEGG